LTPSARPDRISGDSSRKPLRTGELLGEGSQPIRPHGWTGRLPIIDEHGLAAPKIEPGGGILVRHRRREPEGVGCGGAQAAVHREPEPAGCRSNSEAIMA
jgi:hypothetical protein